LDKLLLNTPSQKLRQIEVPIFGLEEVAHLVHYALEQSPPQEFVERLTRNTGGNPLYVLETLQGLLQAGIGQNMKKIMSFPLAPGVHQITQARIQVLSDLAIEILAVGALLGVEFNLSLLLEILKEDAVDVLEALVELEVARLLQSYQQDNQIVYSFVHEKIRESILLNLSPAHKRLLHAKIAGTLEQYLGDRAVSQAARIAYHYQESGNLLKAFEFWIQAAQHDYSLFSTQEATDAFSNAERIIPREPGLSEEQLYQLYASWTDMAFENDNQETLFHINETLLSLGQDRNSDLLIGTAYDGLSDACFASNQFEKGLEFTLDAIPHLQRAENLYELLNAQMHQGVFLYMLGKFSEARKVLYNVLESMPTERDTKFVNLNSYLHFQIGTVEVLTGYPVKGLEFLNQAIEHRGNNPVSPEAMLIYTAIGLANYIKGDFKSGHANACKAIEIGRKLEYQRMLGYAYAYSALNGHNLGLLDGAWEHASQALYIGQVFGHYEITALAYRTFGNTYMRLDDYQSAIEYFKKGIQIAGEHYVALELMTLMGYSLAAVGQVKEGLEYLTKAYETVSQLNMGSISVYAQSLLLFTQSQHNDDNSSLLEEIELALVDSKKRSINKATVILQAPFVRTSQRPEDFIKQMNESLQGASRLPDILLEARILRDLIIYKKNRTLSRGAEVERLNTILEELAPRAVGMPFESAWQNYYNSMKAVASE
jgi:tetratricopeptide (TPR) repeat protein